MLIKDITPSNIRNFVEGNYNFYGKNYLKNESIHQLEQFMYRAYLCRDCLENTKCKHCGCSTPQLFFAPRKMDKLDKWPPFMFDAKDWEQYKQEHQGAMSFTTLFREKLGPIDSADPNFDIKQLVSDIELMLQEHRDKDAENPEIPVEETEFFKGLVDRQSGVSSQYAQTSSSSPSSRSILS